MNEAETTAAIVRDVDLSTGDYGELMLRARLDCGGLNYGLGYAVDSDFLKRFMAACGRDSLKACEGRVVLVTGTGLGGGVTAVGPMPFDTGVPFDIAAWCLRQKATKVDELVAVRNALSSADFAFHQIDRNYFERSMANARTTVDALILREVEGQP